MPTCALCQNTGKICFRYQGMPFMAYCKCTAGVKLSESHEQFFEREKLFQKRILFFQKRILFFQDLPAKIIKQIKKENPEFKYYETEPDDIPF